MNIKVLLSPIFCYCLLFGSKRGWLLTLKMLGRGYDGLCKGQQMVGVGGGVGGLAIVFWGRIVTVRWFWGVLLDEKLYFAYR